MTNTRQLLEDAARAAGMELDYSIRPDGRAFYHSERNALALLDGGWFAPLTDDGDAMRLLVKLGLLVDTNGMHARVCFPYEAPIAYEAMKEDRTAATRLAITRAAAAIGKQMREQSA